MTTTPIITAKEMVRIEALAYAAGIREIDLMEKAGSGIAEMLSHETHVTLLAGKGNNGGDAYVAGRYLLGRGARVIAHPLGSLEQSTPLCREMHRRFVESGGIVQPLPAEPPSQGVILDGLTGTGFHGKARDSLAQAICWVNRASLPVYSIDIPSGVCGNTGEVAGPAVVATKTLYLEWPKLGMFIGNGWNFSGHLQTVSLGLAETWKGQIHPVAYLVDRNAPLELPKIERTRHKYGAGYLLGIAGSEGMGGAALLAGCAALRAGAGIVRLFHPRGMSWGNAPLELIGEQWRGLSERRIVAEMARAKALFMGPGMGRTKDAFRRMRKLLPLILKPVVIDADGLFALSQHPEWTLPPESIVTPHRQEMEQLLTHDVHAPFYERIQRYAEEKQVLVVLKGAPTWIFESEKLPLVLPFGDPGMATAGTGDVLTGIIGALLAQGMGIRRAARTGVQWHGMAGECAAEELTSYCLNASDLIRHLPTVIKTAGHSRRSISSCE